MKILSTKNRFRISLFFRRYSVLLCRLSMLVGIILWLTLLAIYDINKQQGISRISPYAGDAAAQRGHQLAGSPGQDIQPNDLSDNVGQQTENGWAMFGYYLQASDLISLTRTLKDMRHERCQKKYSDDLPKTSIIICFYNEAWSVLLRTIHSVLDRSPAELLEEIILVDDFSDMPHLGSRLEDYINKLDKVHLIRTNKTEGPVKARMLGVSVAKAPVLTFVNPDCECTTGWLEPLLQRIYDKPTAIVCPVLDKIDSGTFEYQLPRNPLLFLGGFDWNLRFRRFMSVERQKKHHPWDPIRTPTISGQVFAIDKEFFRKLGEFRDEFSIWGGEYIELSFKAWMCEGTLEIVPCSHVGYVARKSPPNGYWPTAKTSLKSRARIAEVWMDEYKWNFHREVNYYLGDFGDVEPGKELRKKLNCRSFRWYLENVYPEITVPELPIAYGEIRSPTLGNYGCVDGPEYEKRNEKSIDAYHCHGLGGNQYWELSRENQIRRGKSCIEPTESDAVIIALCEEHKKNQEWLYDPNERTLKNLESGKCLTTYEDERILLMEPCSGGKLQQWTFGFHESQLKY